MALTARRDRSGSQHNKGGIGNRIRLMGRFGLCALAPLVAHKGSFFRLTPILS